MSKLPERIVQRVKEGTRSLVQPRVEQLREDTGHLTSPLKSDRSDPKLRRNQNLIIGGALVGIPALLIGISVGMTKLYESTHSSSGINPLLSPPALTPTGNTESGSISSPSVTPQEGATQTTYPITSNILDCSNRPGAWDMTNDGKTVLYCGFPPNCNDSKFSHPVLLPHAVDASGVVSPDALDCKPITEDDPRILSLLPSTDSSSSLVPTPTLTPTVEGETVKTNQSVCFEQNGDGSIEPKHTFDYSSITFDCIRQKKEKGWATSIAENSSSSTYVSVLKELKGVKQFGAGNGNGRITFPVYNYTQNKKTNVWETNGKRVAILTFGPHCEQPQTEENCHLQ